MLNTINIDRLNNHRLFHVHDLDHAHKCIADKVSPHRINVLSKQRTLDVNFKGLSFDDVSILSVFYGAKVSVAPQGNNFYFLQTTVKGNGKISTDKGAVETQVGDTVVVSPSLNYEMSLEQDCKRIAVGIKPEIVRSYLAKLINREVKTAPVFDLNFQNKTLWNNTLNYILEQVATVPCIEKQIHLKRAYSELIISSLLSAQKHNYSEAMNYAGDSMLNSHVKMAIEFIEANINGVISIAELASNCNVSARSLQRHFLKYVEVGPVEYIRNRKLELIHKDLIAAKNLPSCSVKKILLDYSIIDFGRFSQYYKNRFGCTPSETLNKHKQ